MNDIQLVLKNHPRLLAFIDPNATAERLGGLTNKNYLLTTAKNKLVLRIPGDGTEEYINRAHEHKAAMITSELGVNAKVIFFDPVTGIQVAQFVDGAITMDAEKFKNPEAISRAAASLRQVHDSMRPFENRFELFAMIDGYLEFLSGKNAELPAGYGDVKKGAEGVRQALLKHKTPLVPCHCDPLAENFLDTPTHTYIIDWEYSGVNDPMWDLGDLSVEACFDAVQDEQLLKSYFNGQAIDPFDRGRMILYKAMCDLLWTLWGVIQHVNKNASEDFWAYATRRLQRCKSLMEESSFQTHVQAVIRGPAQ